MDIESISKAITKLRNDADIFFTKASTVCDEEDGRTTFRIRRFHDDINEYWDMLEDENKKTSLSLQKQLLSIISLLIPILKSSVLLNEADERDIGICTKRMRAALKLRNFRSWDAEILHDEDMVLGVNPPGQSENEPLPPMESRKSFFSCIDQVEGIVELLTVTPSHIPDGLPRKNPNLSQAYRPNTAFIMMRINPNNPYWDDVYDTYKQCFKKFGINAFRADEIEHEDVITTRVMEEIKTSEFLVGDLTEERPSVYYEIGYAHSLGRRVMMYRKKGTSIHFDLASYNCPEYENMRELKSHLMKRLEQATNRKPQGN